MKNIDIVCQLKAQLKQLLANNYREMTLVSKANRNSLPIGNEFFLVTTLRLSALRKSESILLLHLLCFGFFRAF